MPCELSRRNFGRLLTAAALAVPGERAVNIQQPRPVPKPINSGQLQRRLLPASTDYWVPCWGDWWELGRKYGWLIYGTDQYQDFEELLELQPNDRLWVHHCLTGYIGVGLVRPQAISPMTPELRHNLRGEGYWAIPVKWLATVPADNGVKERFWHTAPWLHSPSSREAEWAKTLARLRERFNVSYEALGVSPAEWPIRDCARLATNIVCLHAGEVQRDTDPTPWEVGSRNSSCGFA